MAAPQIVGRVFGLLTVLRNLDAYVQPLGRRRHQVEVQCRCGLRYATLSTSLLKGAVRSCRTCSKTRCPLGKVYDQLTVVRYTHNSAGRAVVLCRCTRGNEVQRRAALLLNNMRNHCGCQKHTKWAGVGDISTTFFQRMRRGASVRGLEFEVTIDSIGLLYKAQRGLCALTGLPITFGRRTTDIVSASLDRIDNTKGYIPGNVHWVHKDVNKMKMDFPLHRFIQVCQLVTSKHRTPDQNTDDPTVLGRAPAVGVT
jgi:hypothetical protein